MKPLILFAPGAGAPSTSRWMAEWKARLESIAAVTAFDYPYRLAGRRAPDRLPVLVDAHRKALADARSGHAGKVFLAGKSMGGRIGCHLALEESVTGIVCFGYPLKGMGKGPLRDAVLLSLRTPVLFVQGTRDSLCPLPLLDEVRKKMAAPSELFVVDGGDHSLEVTRSALQAKGETQADVDRRILGAVARFVA